MAGFGFAAIIVCCYVLILIGATLISIGSISAAGPPKIEDRIIFSKNSPMGYDMTLDSSLFEGIEGDPVSYEWHGPFPPASGPNLDVVLPEGIHAVSLFTYDGQNRSGPFTCYIAVEPAFSVSLNSKRAKVFITWPKVEGAQKYVIYRSFISNPSGFKKIVELPQADLSFTDTAVTDVTYLYVVAALSNGQWLYSQVKSAHPYTWLPRWDYPPVIYSLPITHAVVGLPYTYNVLATSIQEDNLLYSLDNPPEGMGIDPQNGLIEWVPASTGDFEVSVMVKDRNGSYTSQRLIVEVDSLTTPTTFPVAQAGGPYSIEQGEDIAFNGSASYSPDGPHLLYEWDFGDGTHDDGVFPIHAYKEPGKYRVTLTVSDGRGGIASDTAMVKVHKCLMPKVQLSVNPSAVLPGEPCSLIWTSQKADQGTSIDHGVGQVGSSGTLMVYPRSTTNFTITAAGRCGNTTDSVTVIVHQPPTVNITASASTIGISNSSTLSWSSINADTVTIDNGIGTVLPNGSLTVSPTSTTNYTITAIGPGGMAKGTVTVAVNQSTAVTINASPGFIAAGQTSTLSWSSFNADTVTIDNGIGTVLPNGSLTVSPTSTTNYTITAIGPGGMAKGTVTVAVNQSTAVTINASPGFIAAGQTSTLSWSSFNADADSVTIDHDIGSVMPNGSLMVMPSASTSYTITAKGPMGTATDTVTVTVEQPLHVSITADPDNIPEGDSSTITWASENADSAMLDNGIGQVDMHGSMMVYPAETTTYTITVQGRGCSTSASVRVNVHPRPVVSISATPDVIDAGEASTLKWNSRNSQRANIDQDIGPVDVNGSIQVSPLKTTTYTITVTDDEGKTTTDQVTITIKNHPPKTSGDPPGIFDDKPPP
jgi:hypothetical protein